MRFILGATELPAPGGQFGGTSFSQSSGVLNLILSIIAKRLSGNFGFLDGGRPKAYICGF